MIGVFDSGYGGLTILRALVELLPSHSYLYYGDNARVPYGLRTADDIFTLTRQGVEYLFRQGCPLVILACNTSSAVALRRIQQEILPKKYPDRRVLGIVVPTIEQISGVSWQAKASLGEGAAIPQTVGVLATEQSVRSQAYPHEIHKRNPNVRVVQQACPQLAQLIEEGAGETALRSEIQSCLAALIAGAEERLSAVLLGCTHYALAVDLIRAALPAGVQLYEQPQIVARSLADYLTRHPELARRLDQMGRHRFVTSGNPAVVTPRAARFFGEAISFSVPL